MTIDKKRLIGFSKFLSLMLRHQPQKFGLVLDAEGFTPLVEVVEALRARYPDASEADVLAIVENIEPDKRRFTIEENEIRANYGHSIADRIAHEAVVPPPTLLHGTTEKALAMIRQSGVLPMARQYVHLTTDRTLAERVGGRRGKALVLTIDSARAYAQGIVFYRANDSFWLADKVPPEFIERDNLSSGPFPQS